MPQKKLYNNKFLQYRKPTITLDWHVTYTLCLSANISLPVCFWRGCDTFLPLIFSVGGRYCRRTGFAGKPRLVSCPGVHPMKKKKNSHGPGPSSFPPGSFICISLKNALHFSWSKSLTFGWLLGPFSLSSLLAERRRVDVSLLRGPVCAVIHDSCVQLIFNWAGPGSHAQILARSVVIGLLKRWTVSLYRWEHAVLLLLLSLTVGFFLVFFVCFFSSPHIHINRHRPGRRKCF